MTLDRREFLGAGAALLGSPALSMIEQRGRGRKEAIPAAGDSSPANITMRAHLCREARRITDSALAEYRDRAAFAALQPEKRRQFIEMMGLTEYLAEPRPPVRVYVTGTVDRPEYRIEKLHYESLPGLHVTANLYLPKSLTDRLAVRPENRAPGADRRLPAVLYVCGHAQNQKVHYQAHPRRLAELGFAALIVETVQLGEVTGYHHGCYREGWFHWYSRGYSPAAIELLNGIRGLDLLSQRPEVDPERLGVTGISGGGATTWWIAAADERVKGCSPVCGTATLESHIYDRVIDGHCDCMWWPNSRMWDLADVGGLIAPRPLLIASADQDGIFPIESIRKVHSQLAGLYRKLGSEDRLRLVETPGGHSYHPKSRTAIFSWFLKHLAGKNVSPERVGDADESPDKQESEQTLKVYAASPPAGNRVTTIHDELIKLSAPPSITDRAALTNERQRITSALKEHTFSAFPANPPALDLKEEYALDGGTGTRFAFTSEEGWRLHGKKMHPRDLKLPAPAVLVLRSPGEERNETEGFAGRIRAAWIKIVAEPRGTGETAWGEDLSWHLRRAAAWTGRTIASMRVWDTLRALQAARALAGVEPGRISLAARGEMCAIALYAALLDGNVHALILDSPPATQNAGSRPDGKGAAIEMLHCLRFTDLPQVAGLTYAPELVLAGAVPETYGWAETLYRTVGPPGKCTRVQDLTAWQPA